MDQRGDEIHATSTEATGASREGVVRWVLIIGLLLVVVLFAVIVMIGTGSQDNGDDSHMNVNREILHDQAVDKSRGEPTMPGYGSSPSAAGTAAATATPSASASAAATPGDAPAGDPSNSAQ
jgi:hypothetical protein